MMNIKNQKIMTKQKIANLLVTTLSIESKLKCILKTVLPKNIKFYLNNPISKEPNYILNLNNNKKHLKIVKRSFFSYGDDIDNFSMGAIVYLINVIDFINLVIKKYNYLLNENIQFVINNLYLICAIRNKLSHPKCKFNISEKEFIKMIEPLKPKKNWNYKKVFKRLFIIEKVLNKILKK